MRVCSIILCLLSTSAFAQELFSEFEVQFKKAECNDVLIDRLELMYDTGFEIVNNYRQQNMRPAKVGKALNDNQVATLLSGHTEVRSLASSESNNEIQCDLDLTPLEGMNYKINNSVKNSCQGFTESFSEFEFTAINGLRFRPATHVKTGFLNKNGETEYHVINLDFVFNLKPQSEFFKSHSNFYQTFTRGVRTTNREVNQLLKQYFTEDDLFLSVSSTTDFSKNSHSKAANYIALKNDDSEVRILGRKLEGPISIGFIARDVCNKMYNKEAEAAQQLERDRQAAEKESPEGVATSGLGNSGISE